MKRLLNMAAKKVSQAEVYSINSKNLSITFEAGKLKLTQDSETTGFALRIEHEGRTGFVTGTDISRRADIVNAALNMSEHGMPFELNLPSRPASFESNDYRGKSHRIPARKMVEWGTRLLSAVKARNSEITAGCRFYRNETKVRILNTSGLDTSCQHSDLSVLVSGDIVGEDDILELYRFGSTRDDELDVDVLARWLLKEAERAREIVPSPTGAVKVLFAPEAVSEMLAGFESGVNGRNIVHGTSPLCNKLDQSILDPRITIIDDGRLKGLTSSMPFDDEGTACQKTVLVKNGVLKGYLWDLRYAARSGQKPTGNGFRRRFMSGTDYSVSPSIQASNIEIKPGKTSARDLMNSIDEGLYVISIPDASSGSIHNGEFSGTVYLGYRIKNGQITGRVKNTVVSGSIYKMLGSQMLDFSKECVSPYGSDFKLPYILCKDVQTVSAS